MLAEKPLVGFGWHLPRRGSGALQARSFTLFVVTQTHPFDSKAIRLLPIVIASNAAFVSNIICKPSVTKSTPCSAPLPQRRPHGAPQPPAWAQAATPRGTRRDSNTRRHRLASRGVSVPAQCFHPHFRHRADEAGGCSIASRPSASPPTRGAAACPEVGPEQRTAPSRQQLHLLRSGTARGPRSRRTRSHATRARRRHRSCPPTAGPGGAPSAGSWTCCHPWHRSPAPGTGRSDPTKVKPVIPAVVNKCRGLGLGVWGFFLYFLHFAFSIALPHLLGPPLQMKLLF